MRRRRIIYSPAAEQDRIDIAIWLTQEASAMVARRFGKRVSDRVKTLEYASERGTVRDDALGLRVVGILPTVAVAFTVTEDAVIIHRVLHNGQSWQPED